MNLNRTLILSLLLLFLPLVVCAQNQVALIASECESVKGLCAAQTLVRFRFRDGALISKDTILTGDRVSFNLFNNQIYRNRYVVTRWSDVVDLQTGELLHNGEGDFVGFDGDRIIERVDRRNLHGFFYFDLATKKYTPLTQPGKWALPGALSPDGTKSADGERDNIWLHKLGQKKKLLGSGFDIEAEAEVSFMAAPPVFWLDDTRLLSQRNNGEIVLVQLNGTVTPIVKIPVDSVNYQEPEFSRDRAGRIIYSCCGQSYVINVEQKSYELNKWVTLGFGFDAENQRSISYGHIIRYQDKEIGRLWASVWLASTIDGYAAFEYGPIASNLGYPKGIKVWSSVNGQWTTIDLKWLTTIIGWVKE